MNSHPRWVLGVADERFAKPENAPVWPSANASLQSGG